MKNFDLNWEEKIEDINGQASFYIHKKTKSEVLVIKNDDENKVFNISFKTLPASSNGAAHILEHCVLNGGTEKYPVKEPFIHLYKVSLATFLNALTYDDKTVYPVSSKNDKDFKSLMDFYLDAVFNPRLSKELLMQEGWRYDLSEDEKKLEYQGVVFNEMKGSLSNPSSLLVYSFDEFLYPNSPYGYNSGGNPEVIPSLTYKEFVKFHRKHYHPTNARTVLYGNLDVEEKLRQLDEYFSKFSQSKLSPTKKQAPFTAAKQKKIEYGISEKKDINKNLLGWAWVLDLPDEERLAMEVLAYIMLGSDGSLLKEAMMGSGLCEDIIYYGFYDGMLQPFFGFGAWNVHPKNKDKLSKVVKETISNLAKKIDPDLLEAGINKIDFEKSEADYEGKPRGIVYADFTSRYWLYGGDPRKGLRFKKILSGLRKHVEDSDGYFESLLSKHLIKNKHHLFVEAVPKLDYLSKKQAREEKNLKIRRDEMNQKDINTLKRDLEKYQEWKNVENSPKDLAKLSTLKVSDLKKKVEIPSMIEDTLGNNITVLHNDIVTNGITYINIAFDLKGLSKELLPYVKLYALCLEKLGTSRTKYLDLAVRIDKELGGFWHGVDANTHIKTNRPVNYLIVSSKFLSSNIENASALLSEMLFETNFEENKSRLKQIILEEKARLESVIVSRGSAFARVRAMSSLNAAYFSKENISNISYLKFLQKTSKEMDLDKITKDLKRLHKHFGYTKKVINLTSSAKDYKFAEKLLLPSFESSKFKVIPDALKFEKATYREAFEIASEVNFVGEAFDISRFKVNGALRLIRQELENGFLWDEVRVKSGAYGVGCLIFDNSKLLTLSSYRDPNIEKTYETFGKISDVLTKFKPSKKEFESLKIGASRMFDPYLTPREEGERALSRYLSGVSNSILQGRYQQLLEADTSIFKDFGDFLGEIKEEHKSKVVLGNAKSISKFNQDNNYKVYKL
jgi:Zn-dependent M16 (insulinase) family peptidase